MTIYESRVYDVRLINSLPAIDNDTSSPPLKWPLRIFIAAAIVHATSRSLSFRLFLCQRNRLFVRASTSPSASFPMMSRINPFRVLYRIEWERGRGDGGAFLARVAGLAISKFSFSISILPLASRRCSAYSFDIRNRLIPLPVSAGYSDPSG